MKLPPAPPTSPVPASAEPHPLIEDPATTAGAVGHAWQRHAARWTNVKHAPVTLEAKVQKLGVLASTCEECLPYHFARCEAPDVPHAGTLAMITSWAHGLACAQSGLCTCDVGFIFDGERCVRAERLQTAAASQETLANRWFDTPACRDSFIGQGHEWTCVGGSNTRTLMAGSDAALVAAWQRLRLRDCMTTYHAGALTGKRVLDVGSGFARASMSFALSGAHVTFSDVVPNNLAVLRRLASVLGVANNTDFLLLNADGMERELLARPMYDTVTSFGSLHHTPSPVVKQEVATILRRLRRYGSWIMLMYPWERYSSWAKRLRPRRGRRSKGKESASFPQFCDHTDHGCPWAEWYSPGKWLDLVSPARFDLRYCAIVRTPSADPSMSENWMEWTYLGGYPEG